MNPRTWFVAAVVLAMVAAVVVVRLGRAPDAALPPAPAVAADATQQTGSDSARETSASPFGTDEEICAEHRALIEREALDTSNRTRTEEAAAQRTLLASQSPEVLASIALMTRDPEERKEAISRAMATGVRDATVVWSAVLLCDRAPDDLRCPAQEWENQLLELDSENSQVWIRIAASRYEQGDAAKALEALHRAAAAAGTREYMVETVQMVERALDSAGGYSFPERSTLAFGIAAANLPAYESYLRMCRRQSEDDAEWAQTCLDYGRLVERTGKTLIGVSMARAIEIAALDAMNNTAEAEAVAVRKYAAENERARLPIDPLAERTLLSNPRQFAAYLALIEEKGERAAAAELRVEADRIAKRCPPKPEA